MERWFFSLQDPIFRYFSDFHRLVRVRSASMTNTKPTRGVVCHYWDMYARIVGSCKIKIEDFNPFLIRNHISLHLLLSVHSSSQVKLTHVLFPFPPHGSLTLEPPTK